MKDANNTLTWTGQKEWEPWTGSNRCPNCGGSEIEYNTGLVLTSYPAQSQLRCKSCGHHFSSGFAAEWTDNDSLSKEWQHDQSILGIPRVGDWPPAPTPCDPLPATDKTTMYGWICPKCGRCLAPHVNSCPHCNNTPTTINITY
jgi:hypothetical protein